MGVELGKVPVLVVVALVLKAILWALDQALLMLCQLHQ